jgi:hypothetical protein
MPPTEKEEVMSSNNWERYAPLTGVAFFVIVLIGFLIGGDTPGSHDSAIKAEAFYTRHRDQQMVASFIIMWGAIFLPFFVSTLKRALDWSGGTGRLANACFAGGIIYTMGFFLLATVHLALADGAGKTTPQVTQTLNVLDNNDFIPVGAGLGIFILSAGLAIVRYRALPAWLGWSAIVIGILAFTPAGFFAFLLGGVWILVTSIVLFMSSAPAQASRQEPMPG